MTFKKERSPVHPYLDSAAFRQDLAETAYERTTAMLFRLASVYRSQIVSPNYALIQKYVMEETSRLLYSGDNLADQQHLDLTRPEWLYQVWGNILHNQDPNFFPGQISDQEYRALLQALRDALLEGSTLESIQQGVQIFTDLPVELLALFQLSNEFVENSPFDESDNNKIRVSLDIPQEDGLLVPSPLLDVLLPGVNFAISLTKPAEALYDLRLRVQEDGFNIGAPCETLLGDDGYLQAVRVTKELGPNPVSSVLNANRVEGIIDDIDGVNVWEIGNTKVRVDSTTIVTDTAGNSLDFDEIFEGDFVRVEGTLVDPQLTDDGFTRQQATEPFSLCDTSRLDLYSHQQEAVRFCRFTEVQELTVNPVQTDVETVDFAFSTFELLEEATFPLSVDQSLQEDFPLVSLTLQNSTAGLVLSQDLQQQEDYTITVNFDVEEIFPIPINPEFEYEDLTPQYHGSHLHDTFYVNNTPIVTGNGQAKQDWLGESVTVFVDGTPVPISYVNPLIGKIVLEEPVLSHQTVEIQYTWAKKPVYAMVIDQPEYGVDLGLPYPYMNVVDQLLHQGDLVSVDRIVSGNLPAPIPSYQDFPTLSEFALNQENVSVEVSPLDNQENQEFSVQSHAETILANILIQNSKNSLDQTITSTSDHAEDFPITTVNGYQTLVLNSQEWLDPNFERLIAGQPRELGRVIKNSVIRAQSHLPICEETLYDYEISAFDLAANKVIDDRFGFQVDTLSSNNKIDYARIVQVSSFPRENTFGSPDQLFERLKAQSLVRGEPLVYLTQDLVNAMNKVFHNFSYVPSESDILNSLDNVLNSTSLKLNFAQIQQIRNSMQALYACLKLHKVEQEGCCDLNPIGYDEWSLNITLEESIMAAADPDSKSALLVDIQGEVL